MNSRFYFATCQIAAEKVVKEEWKFYFPKLNFAFSRPGFVTFKDADGRAAARLNARPGIFTRLMGESIDQAKGEETQDGALPKSLLSKVPEGAILHIFERDQFFPGDEHPEYNRTARVESLITELKREKKFKVNVAPQVRDKVYDLIWLDVGHWFLGVHEHSKDYDTSPGNIPDLKLPDTAPSRSYLKIAEVTHRFGINPGEAEMVLEVGCSPGGASHAMLNWGLSVVGVDPKGMAENVTNHENFKLIQKMAKNVSADDVKDINPDWLVMDINLTPKQALDEITHVVSLLKKKWGTSLRLKRGFLTLKMNDWSLLPEVPQYLKQIEKLGFKNLSTLQLVSNRQEFMVYCEK